MTAYALNELKPLTVKDYTLWLEAKAGFELNLNSLPPKLARLKWFDALWQHDRASAEAVLRVLAVSCGLPVIQGKYPIRVELETEDRHPAIPSPNDGLQHVYTVYIFAFLHHGRWTPGGPHLRLCELDWLRERICTLNGYHMPGADEEPPLPTVNPWKGRHVDFNLKAMVAAVAVQTGHRPCEVEEWTIPEFNEAISAITRMEQYRICRLLESTGLFEWKHGNPCPLWTLEMKSDLPPGYASIKELDESAAGLLTSTTVNSNLHRNGDTDPERK